MLTLSQLKKYIEQQKRVSKNALCLLFKETPELVETLLQHLERKGLIKLDEGCYSNCGSRCSTCPIAKTTNNKIYCWSTK